MSGNFDRKVELEQKKAKLRALREDKLKREESKRHGGVDSNSTTGSAADLRLQTDNILQNLGIETLPDTILPEKEENNSNNIQFQRSTSFRRKKLQFSTIFDTNIKPQISASYDKEIQTVNIETESEPRAMDYYVLTYEETPSETDHLSSSVYADRDNVDKNMLKSVHGEIPRQNITIAKEELNEPALVELTMEQKQQMLLSDGFRQFFNRSSRIVERALCLPEDIYKDYSGKEVESETSGELLPFCRDFYDDHWSKNRAVTGLDWSQAYPELLLAAYSPNEEVLHEPEGCCMIWNLKFPNKQSPEYIFHCSEPITAAAMARFHPNLVIGGTYSGQIVLWDTRVTKRTPVQRSTLTSGAHTQSLTTVQVIGTQNAHNIITVSSDGSLCAWSVDMLGQPREKLKVCETPSTGLLDVYPTCMSFFANDQNNFVVGSENGNIYTDQRHSSRSSSAVDGSSRRYPYKGHSTFVTSVSTHPSPGTISFSHLFLSSSLDWTVKLWSIRDQVPLHTFDDYSECIYDVGWSPIHPALFVAVDGTGRIDVWNLNNDVEVPTARCQLPVNSGQNDPAAIHKVKWDPTGLFLAAGDDEGHVRVCTVAESLAHPAAEDWSILTRVLANLKSTSLIG